MTSSTNERQIKARKATQKQARIDDELITGELMSNPRGRGWVWRRLTECYIFAEDESLDPYWMAYMKGRRNVGLRLLKDVQGFCPAQYATMVEEATSVSIYTAPQDEENDDE